ncbi:DNA mismatch repair protein MutS [Fulvivirgaceae bacterium BMA12]|uniref:DNA mismatch repair protein MutS n=1 Tax=Agaribacillus aureus TaxID=3051825 RepID=A0ABT8L0K6_9BACT|nr:DNA mismatch repair protein MutS [Fulvivirgaceae bacterium BMA12]
MVSIYQNNIEKYKAADLKLAKDLNGLSTLRLAAFIFSFIIIAVLANSRLLVGVLVVIPLCVLGFGWLIKRYNEVAYQKRHYDFLKTINEKEILKLQNKLADFPTGQKFTGRDHPYVSDLDIFGHHSLFQLIDRTTTESGHELLAEWMTVPASKKTILERQQAVKELSSMLDWRQHFQATGMPFRQAKSDYNKLLAWIEKPEQLLPNQSKYLVLSTFLSLLSTSAVIYFVIHLFLPDPVLSLIPLTIVLYVNSRVLKSVRPAAEEIIENTLHNLKVLAGYRSLILRIESQKFESAVLQKLQSALNHDNYSAANEINKLTKILEVFHLRGTKKEPLSSGLFYLIFNMFWLFDVYYILLTEKWKHKNKSYLKPWALAVSEFEVLSSMAGFHYSNPSFAFPEIKEEPYIINFEMLGHPLIDPKSRVCNHFNLNGRGEIAMITGSNMAGKSTFLRTIGVNLVLALMGAPCCAKSGQVSNMKIFTSMRTQDNLEEGVSSFYAELKRIEQLLKLIKDGQPIFFLLDEMFKGTNSQDRYKGGVSLIRQLGELNAFGVISTHDLALAKLAGKHMIVANYSFNSEIKEGEMIFNYELTQGICRDFNASELMKKSGIKILSNIEEM